MLSRERSCQDVLPLISVVIATHNRKEKVIKTIKSILGSDYALDKLEVIVVDDASTDGTCEALNEVFSGNVRIVQCLQERFPAECRNIGLKYANGRYVLFVDDDVIVDRNLIAELTKFMETYQDVGIAGPIIFYMNRPSIIWCAGVKIDAHISVMGKYIGYNKLYTGQFYTPMACDSIPSIFMVRKDIATKLKFHSKIFPIQLEETDFCFRVGKTGWKVVVIPSAKAWHDKRLGSSLAKPVRAYFESRNHLIAAKLWSKDYIHYVMLTLQVIMHLPLHIILAALLSQERVKTLKAVINGLVDGLKMAKKLRSYEKWEHKICNDLMTPSGPGYICSV